LPQGSPRLDQELTGPRHERIPEKGILSIRYDITDKFKLKSGRILPDALENQVFLGNSRGEIGITAPKMPSGIFSASATAIDVDKNFSKLLEQNNGICLNNRQLCATSWEETSEIHKVVGEISDTRWRSDPVIIRIKKDMEGEYLFMKVGMLPGSLCANDYIYGVCKVSVFDPMECVHLPFPVLNKIFGLTPAEAHVATRLVSGLTPEEIAIHDKISIGTVRNHTKKIFKKTSVNRRSDLVRLFVNLSSAIGC
jgi:DNA-binding CsgD family transcriptional regulator